MKYFGGSEAVSVKISWFCKNFEHLQPIYIDCQNTMEECDFTLSSYAHVQFLIVPVLSKRDFLSYSHAIKTK